MKLANIVPTSCLPHIEKQETHLCLANRIVSDPVYYNFYRRQVVLGKTVILDNPVHEDQPVRLDNWLFAIQRLNPTIAILPDTIDDADHTIASARGAARHVSDRVHFPALMAVPHAETQKEWLKCAQQLLRISGVFWLGISLERRLRDDPRAAARRLERLKLIRDEIHSYVPVHFLGISEAAGEFNDPRCRTVASADASKFAVWALTGNPQYPPVPLREPYPGRKVLGGPMGYFDYDGEVPDDLHDNLTQWSTYAEESW